MKCEIEAIVELDRMNMAPIIESAGGQFDSAFRRGRVEREIAQGAEFLCHVRDGVLLGYLEFMMEPHEVCNVYSVQLHPDYHRGWVLRHLLKEAYMRMREIRMSFIKSSVHVTNKASLRFHEKLGFRKESQTAERVALLVEGDVLLSRLTEILRIRANTQ